MPYGLIRSDWVLGTPEGEHVSMAVLADGSYGVSDELIFSYPVTCKDGAYSIVQGLTVSDFAQGKMDVTRKELTEERTVAFEMVGLQ